MMLNYLKVTYFLTPFFGSDFIFLLTIVLISYESPQILFLRRSKLTVKISQIEIQGFYLNKKKRLPLKYNLKRSPDEKKARKKTSCIHKASEWHNGS